MPDAIITATASTFGTISGTFAADQSTITGTVSAIIPGTLSGSVGVPGPQGIQGIPGPVGPEGPPGVGGAWGTLTGTLSAQTDLWTALGSKYDASNPAGYITSAALSPYLLSSTAASTYYPLSNPSNFATQSFVTGQGYITGTALVPYLTSATAASTYQPLAGMSSYLTTSAAASTYAPIAAGMPTSGTIGQVLTKNSGTSYDASWATLIPGDRYVTTSSSSLSVSNGSKSLTIGTGLAYTPNQDVTISLTSDPTLHHMHGPVVSYNSGTGALVVDVQNHTGSGTYSSWTVNVGGTVPLETVEWGEILGVIGDQSDLAAALNSKLDSTDAASTYQTISGMSSYLTTSAASSTYYLQTNPAGYITSSALSGYATESWVSSQGYLTSASLSGYATESWVTAGFYPLTGNPSGFLTSASLTGYATESWVTSQGYITSSALSPYLLSSTASSTYRALSNNTFGSIGITAGNSLTIDDGGSAIGETVLQNSGLLIRDTSNVPLARFQYDQVLIPSAGITFSDATVQTTAGISEATADANYYPLTGNPSSFITSSALTPYALKSGATFTGEIILPASTTATASLTIPHGSAPSTPVDGEIWTTTAGLFYRINGATVSPATLAGGTYTGKITTVASTTTTAGFRIPVGTAPTAPTQGDMWLVSGAAGSIVFQGNGTQTVATLGYTQTFTGNNTFSGATLTFGNSTAASTVNIATGATATATTKTVNVGTAGTSGSTTSVNIGSSVSGATSTITLNGTVNATGLANGVKAWVNFNGTGTVAIRASFNVSSITDNGAADYTVNFTTAISDANYSTLTTSNWVIGNNTQWAGGLLLHPTVAPTTTAVRLQQTAIADFTYCNVAIIR